MFYNRFVVLQKPILIAEGKTDYVYLRAAIKGLPTFHPVLRPVISGTATNNISFLNHSHLTRAMLGLDASTSYLIDFISNYRKTAATFEHCPMQHPVIILIDNDDGAKSVFNLLRQMKINVEHKTTAPFYHVVRNLYLIKTPESTAPNCYSQIEELFDAATLGVKLNGKSFNMKNETDTATEYGKAYFADYVVGPSAKTINFVGFTPLLDRIVQAISYHAALVAAGAV